AASAPQYRVVLRHCRAVPAVRCRHLWESGIREWSDGGDIPSATAAVLDASRICPKPAIASAHATLPHRRRYANRPDKTLTDMALTDSNVLKTAPDAATYRTAPHNIEAEQSLLGAILVNNEAFYRVSDFLEPKHFYEPIHQHLYETIGS